MKKLSLDLDDIAVESFPTDAAELDGGTVAAHELFAMTRNRTCARTSCCPDSWDTLCDVC